MTKLYILLTLFVLIISTLAASPPSFCKCTCGTNSTIIPLSTHTSPTQDTPRAASTTCRSCDKAFCKAQHLPICKTTEEKDVLTTCFQRDSRKDQIVVLIFIGVTLGLLGWAAVKKVLEKRNGDGGRISDTQQGYARVEGR